MNVCDALKNRRTIRKFKNIPIEREKLKELVNYARLAPFAANIQALKYKIVTDENTCSEIFSHVHWAGYLPDGAPKEGHKPTAYIAVLGDTEIKKNFETDAGTAVQSILLGAWEMGIGTCWMGAIDRPQISELLKLSEKFSLLYIIALGYADEESRESKYCGSPKYFYDESGTLNVPKLSLDDIIL